MGVVYKARDTRLDRTVALKFLPHDRPVTGEEENRLLQEARSAAALNHPNVCSIIDIQEDGGRQFIVMEFVEGESLKSIVRRGTLGAEQIIDIGSHIAEGLKAAHEKGVIHRDIKSENIMVTKDHQVKIMDFGLAKLGAGKGLTRTGSTVGTVAYMSPEQIQALDVDHRADLWSLGVVLYEMIAGSPPFRGEHEAAIMYEILNVEPKATSLLRRDLPGQIHLVVSQLLRKDRSKRPSSAAEVAERLSRRATPVAAPREEKSIAVLYFENMSAEKESEYFCAGVTEDIITDLSKISELKVVPRNDVAPFRNKEVNIRHAGESLRVNFILEGSVRKAGNRIRISAQLIDVHTGFQAWAERYDRLVDDIFDLQDDIAANIVKALKISLKESEKDSLGKKPTEDLRAYDFYLRGRDLLYRRGKKNNEAAIAMFDHALSLDPRFAAAHAALAEAYSYMYSWYDGETRWLAKTIEASQKALDLNPQLVESIFGMGIVSFHQKRYAEAKRTLERVIELKPDYYDAYRWLGIISDILGEYDSALGYYQHCIVLKPYSEEPWMHLEMTYRRKGDNDASTEARRRMLEAGERILEVNPDDAIVLSRLASAHAHLGQPEKSLQSLQRLLEIEPGDGLVQYNCACAFALLGRKKEALESLRSAIQSGYKNVCEWVKSDPDFVSLRDDQEFKALLTEIG